MLTDLNTDKLIGRDLHDAVAVEVMGWKKNGSPLDGLPNFSPTFTDLQGCVQYLRDWHPSTNPLHCADVERELWRRGARVGISFFGWFAPPSSLRAAITDKDGETVYHVQIESPADDPVAGRCLATCRAAVKWARARATTAVPQPV